MTCLPSAFKALGADTVGRIAFLAADIVMTIIALVTRELTIAGGADLLSLHLAFTFLIVAFHVPVDQEKFISAKLFIKSVNGIILLDVSRRFHRTEQKYYTNGQCYEISDPFCFGKKNLLCLIRTTIFSF